MRIKSGMWNRLLAAARQALAAGPRAASGDYILQLNEQLQ